MKERPILFSAPMVRALLAGTKTQTRRIVSAAGVEAIEFLGGHADDSPVTADDICLNWTHSFEDDSKKKRYPPQWCVQSAEYPEEGCIPIGMAYGNVGDHLWVREAWRTESDHYNDLSPSQLSGEETILYAADADWSLNKSVGRARASMHMPRWASRILLEVVSVRVERLQAITKADAEAEGVAPWRDEKIAHVAMYRELWESINGPNSWAANPWVWRIEFKRLTP